jgi:hypothetical protein
MRLVMNPERKRLAGHMFIGLCFLFLAVVWPPSYFIDSAIAGYFIVLADSFLRQIDPHQRATNFRVASLLVIFTIIVLPIAESLEAAARPATMDGLFRAADMHLGLDGFALSRFCLAHASTYYLTIGVYSSLPLVMALAWIASRSFVYLRAALGGTLLALPCYLLFPAVGPQYAFIGWPGQTAQLQAVVGAGHPRNCMPSMHFTWAALAAVNVRGRWQPLFFAYAGLMGLATVASGEHYSIDVLAAIPFLLGIQWTARRLGRKYSPVAPSARILAGESRDDLK